MPGLRVFFASDIHGSDVCFRKFVGAAGFYKANVIIMGGDITGKAILPIIEGTDGKYHARLHGKESTVPHRELENLMEKTRDTGYYPYLTTQQDWTNLLENTREMDELFERLVTETLRRWIDYAETKLANKPVSAYVSPGNDDSYAIDNVLNSSQIIVNPNERILRISDQVEMLSLGYSNVTPWRCPRDIPDEEIGEKIDKLFAEADPKKRLIFTIHVPPYGSGIDEAPELDEEMRPKMGPGGQIRTAPVGSLSTRKAIEKYEPLLGLHGHVHEAKGFTRIGRTVCFNPGSEYQEGVLRGVLVQLSEQKVRDFVFTSG